MAQRPFRGAEADPPDVGANTTIAALREEAAHCTRCDLYKYATQTVFGEGPEDAGIVMVGEVAGRPGGFAGKAVRRTGRRAARPRAGRSRHDRTKSMSPMR